MLALIKIIFIISVQYEMSFDAKSATLRGMGGIHFTRPTSSIAVKKDVTSVCNCIASSVDRYNAANVSAVPTSKQDVDNGNRKAAFEAAIANQYSEDDKGKVKCETLDMQLPLDPDSECELYGKVGEWQGSTFNSLQRKKIHEQLQITGNLAWGITKTKIKIGGNNHEFTQTNFYKVWEIAVGKEEKTMYTPQKQERTYEGDFGAAFAQVNGP